MRDMSGLIEYSLGFIDGVKAGKNSFLKNIGYNVKEALNEFIDSNARVNPQALQHVYEWYQNGSPDARLYDITCKVTGQGLSINSTFKQSSSIKAGSSTPFYDKARIMEDGIPVVIRPVKSSVLSFDDNGNQVFTKRPIQVDNPGGTEAQGSYQKIFESFFRDYLSQTFLLSSGIRQYLERPVAYKNNVSRAKSGGRSLGVEVGHKWIEQAGELL